MTPKKMKERPVNYWVSVKGAKIDLTVGNWPPPNHLGTFTLNSDGFYYYWPTDGSNGCFMGWLLIALGNELGKLNKTWDNMIRIELAVKRIKKR